MSGKLRYHTVRGLRVTALVALLAPPVTAQDGISLGQGSRSVFEQPAAGISGILDPSRLDVSHTLSMQYTSSSRPGPGDGMLGMYENRMSYRIADPLNLTLYLGYQFRPSAGDHGGGLDQNRILPGFALTYRPNDNFLMQLSYRKLGYGTSAYPSFGDRYLFDPGK